ARAEQSLEQGRIRLPARQGRMRAETAGCEERARQVDPDGPRALSRGRSVLDRREELLLRRGDESGEVGGDAGLEQRLAGAPVAGGVGVEEVDTAEAVHLQVDEAGSGHPAAVAAGEAAPRDGAVRDLDVARQEGAVDDGRLDAEPHL